MRFVHTFLCLDGDEAERRRNQGGGNNPAGKPQGTLKGRDDIATNGTRRKALPRTAGGWTKKSRKDIWMTTDERFYRKEKYSML